MRAPYAILLVSLAFAAYAKEQTVGVKGRLLCGKEPIVHTDVQLLVHDTFTDRVLSTVHTDSTGYFQIQGSHDKAYAMKTYVKYFFYCNPNNAKPDPNAKCTRVWGRDIPESADNDGKTVGKWFDLKDVVMNPDAKMPGEEQDCKN